MCGIESVEARRRVQPVRVDSQTIAQACGAVVSACRARWAECADSGLSALRRVDTAWLWRARRAGDTCSSGSQAGVALAMDGSRARKLLIVAAMARALPTLVSRRHVAGLLQSTAAARVAQTCTYAACWTTLSTITAEASSRSLAVAARSATLSDVVRAASPTTLRSVAAGLDGGESYAPSPQGTLVTLSFSQHLARL